MQSAKYHNVKVKTSDGAFDSKKENKRWLELKQMEEEGLIADLRRQIPFELVPAQPLDNPRKMRGKSGRMQYKEPAVRYFADFVYVRDGKTIVEDVKGGWMRTPEYIIKRKLMKLIHDIEIVEV